MEKDLDNKLYNDYLNGEKEAFNFLYNKYKKRIEYFIYNIVKDYQKAEDLTQETFLYVMQNKMKDNYSFKYHIYLRAKSIALNFIKIENNRNEITEKYLFSKDEQIEKDVLDIISKEESKKELFDSIKLLAEKYRNALYLTNIEGLSYEETSKILGETLQNTKNLVHRGKIELRKILLKKGFDEMNKFAKVIVIILIATIFIGGAVYALTNIKISVKPVFKWFKVNFSDEYENYREEIHGEIIQAPSESSIELVSTVCDEGVVILEFDIKLSEQDKKYLKIGEPILTEEYINATDDEDSKAISYEYDKETGKAIEIPKKEMILNKYADKKIGDSIRINYNLSLEDYNNYHYSEEGIPYIYSLSWNCVIIDGECKIPLLTPQKITQISEYEYKLYQMYFLTDRELGNKTEFTLTMKDWVIITEDRQIHDLDTYLEIDGEFNIELSKNKALENTKKIEANCDKVIYENKDLTQRIESVKVTPLQTIIKVESTYKNVSESKLTDVNREDWIGVRGYKVLDENEEEINSSNYEFKRKIIYSDGTEEEWNPRQIEPTRYSFENATLVTIDYILIEKHEDDSKIKIVSQDGNGIKKIEYTDIGTFEIDLSKEIKE